MSGPFRATALFLSPVAYDAAAAGPSRSPPADLQTRSSDETRLRKKQPMQKRVKRDLGWVAAVDGFIQTRDFNPRDAALELFNVD